MLRSNLFLAALLVFGLSQTTQQSPQQNDPDFDAKVAKPAFVDKHPSVVIDEAHNNFHTAGGRYKAFADLMTNDGCTIKQGIAPFTEKVLAGHDVLVISNARGADKPTDSAFAKDEIEAVHKWVSDGGSLLLIADHAPMGVAAKDLAKRFDVEMSCQFTRDSKNCAESNPSWLVFSRDNKLLIDCAITNGRDESEKLKSITTFTGQSLKGPEGCIEFLKLGDSAEDSMRATDEKKTSAAGRAQGIALKVGKGRVVVVGEAAVLSAQMLKTPAMEKPLRVGMTYPGSDNRQLALNIMHWLTGKLD